MSDIASYKELVLAAAPLAYFPIDPTDGLTDLSGNGSVATPVGGITVGDVAAGSGPGDALGGTTFDGVDDRITTTFSLDARIGLTTTFEGWAYRSSDTSLDIILGTVTGAGASRFDVQIASGSEDLQLLTPGVTRTEAGAWTLATWIHWMLVLNDSAHTSRFYLNSVALPIRAGNGALTTPGTLEIGNRSTFNPYHGMQGHVAIYDGDVSSIAFDHWSWGISTADSRSPSFGLPSAANFPSPANLPTGETLGQL